MRPLTTSLPTLKCILCSLTPTFAACAVFLNNARWDGVPFLLKAGKALEGRMAEIRVQFRHVPGSLYRDKLGFSAGMSSESATNELVSSGVGNGDQEAKPHKRRDGLPLAILHMRSWRRLASCSAPSAPVCFISALQHPSMPCLPALGGLLAPAILLPHNRHPRRPSQPQVIRIQPNESIYLKINNKVPGLGLRVENTRLDLTYGSRYQTHLPGQWVLLREMLLGFTRRVLRSTRGKPNARKPALCVWIVRAGPPRNDPSSPTHQPSWPHPTPQTHTSG